MAADTAPAPGSQQSLLLGGIYQLDAPATVFGISHSTMSGFLPALGRTNLGIRSRQLPGGSCRYQSSSCYAMSSATSSAEFVRCEPVSSLGSPKRSGQSFLPAVEGARPAHQCQHWHKQETSQTVTTPSAQGRGFQFRLPPIGAQGQAPVDTDDSLGSCKADFAESGSWMRSELATTQSSFNITGVYGVSVGELGTDVGSSCSRDAFGTLGPTSSGAASANRQGNSAGKLVEAPNGGEVIQGNQVLHSERVVFAPIPMSQFLLGGGDGDLHRSTGDDMSVCVYNAGTIRPSANYAANMYVLSRQLGNEVRRW